MSELTKNVTNSTSPKSPEQHQRAHAVAAALEVIAGFVASGGPSISLAVEFENLSDYADKIQEALKTK